MTGDERTAETLNQETVQAGENNQQQNQQAGQSGRVGTETVESIKEGRAHFQNAYQQEKQKSDALTEEVSSIKEQIAQMQEQFSQQYSPTQGNQETVAPSSSQSQQGQEFEEEDEYMTVAAYKRIRQQERQEEEARQAQWRFQREHGQATQLFNTLQKKVPEDIFNKAVQVANKRTPRIDYEGGPTAYIGNVQEVIEMELAKVNAKNPQPPGTGQPSSQVQNALEVSQPQGAGGAPPTPDGLEKWNKEQADDIAPDEDLSQI